MNLLLAAKAILFDVDGTLVDSNEFHVLAWAEAIRNAGLTISRYDLRHQIGKGSKPLLETLFPALDKQQIKWVSGAHGEIFKTRFLPLVRPFPAAQALIESLAASGKKVALASSSNEEEIRYYIDLLGIRQSLVGWACGDQVEASKPAHDIFSAALKKVGVAATDALAVGDTPYDAESARKCGIMTMLLRTGGFSERELHGSGAKAVCSDLREMLGLLAGERQAAAS